MSLYDDKVTFVSHILAAFRPVPQSCTSSTLLRRMSKTDSSYATLSTTFIIKQALSFLCADMPHADPFRHHVGGHLRLKRRSTLAGSSSG